MTSIEVYRPPERYTDPETATRADEIETRLHELQDAGRIDEFDIHKRQTGTPVERRQTASGQRKWMTCRFDECREWAHRNELQLGGGFEEQANRGYISFPDLYLITRVEDTVVGVFPCAERDDGELREYGVEEYLNAVENGTEWRTDPRSRQVLTDSDHDRYQAHLKSNAEEYLGEGWRHFATERVMSASGPGRDNPQADLVFVRSSDNEPEYRVVEVKPTAEEVRTAIGQVLEYTVAFRRQKRDIGVSPDRIRPAVAAPRFGDLHRTVASDIGIELVGLS